MSTRSSPSSVVTRDAVEALAQAAPQDRDSLADELDRLGPAALERVIAFHADWQPGLVEATSSHDSQRVIAAIEELLTEHAPEIVAPTAWILSHHEHDAAPALLRLTRHRDPRVREAAAWALGRLPPLEEDEVLRLAACLGDESHEVRRRVAAALEHAESLEGLGTAPLETATRDADPDIRAAACRLLGRVGTADDEVIAALEAVLGVEDEDSRLAAALALAKLHAGHPSLQSIFDALQEAESRDMFLAALARQSDPSPEALALACEAARDACERTRAAAAEAIGRIAPRMPAGDEEGDGEEAFDLGHAVEALADLLDDEDAGVRGRAVSALGRLPAGAIQHVTGDLLAFLEAEDGEPQLDAARVLTAADHAAPAIASLIELTDDDDVYRCASAARALGELFLGDPDADEVLRDLIEDDEPEVRIEAALALANQEGVDPAVAKILAEGLGSRESRVRKRAAECLLAGDDEAASEALVRALSHSRWRTRELAAESISDLLSPGPALVPALEEALHDPKPAVRRAAIVATGDLLSREDDQLGEATASLRPILRERLRDESARTRLTAAVVLAALEERGDEVARELAAGLASDDPELRRMAANAHEHAADLAEANAPALAALLGDEDETVREAAASALKDPGEAAQTALLATLRAGPVAAREMAAFMLGTTSSNDNQQVGARLALGDASPSVRRLALGQLSQKSAADVPAETWSAIQARTQDRDPRMRALALRALAATTDEGRAQDLLVVLGEAVRDPDPLVRAHILPCVDDADLGSANRVALCSTLLVDENPYVALKACSALKEEDPTEASHALPALRAALHSEHEGLPVMAAGVLVELGEPGDAVPVLTRGLTEGDAFDRRMAAQGLSQAGEEAAPARAALLAATRDEDGEVRGYAAIALGGIGAGDEEVHAELRRGLDDAVPQVRLAAIAGLQRARVTDGSLVKKLAPLLQDSNHDVRLQTCALLSEIGPEARRTAPAVSVLLDHDHPITRAMAAYTLVSIIEPGDEVIAALAEVLEADEPLAMRVAVSAAARLGDRAAPLARGLARALLAEDFTLANAAAMQLERLGAAGSPAADRLLEALGADNTMVRDAVTDILAGIATHSKEVLDQVVAVAGEPDPARKRDAFSVLMALPSKVRFPARSLVGALEDPDPILRGKAAIALGRESMEDPVVRAALEPLLEDDEPTVRLAGAASLATKGAAGIERLLPILEGGLDSDDSSDVALAAAAMARLGAAAEPERDRLATAFARHENLDARSEIIHALGSMGSAASSCAEMIAGFLQETEHPSVRHLCIWSLVEINAPAAVAIDTLRASLADPVEANRSDAAYALGRLKPRSVTQAAIPDLITMLETDTPPNRVMAASVLGEFGPRARKAVDALQAVRKAPDRNLASTATWALERIQPDLV